MISVSADWKASKIVCKRIRFRCRIFGAQSDLKGGAIIVPPALSLAAEGTLVAFPELHRAVVVVIAIDRQHTLIIGVGRLPGQVGPAEIGGIVGVQGGD